MNAPVLFCSKSEWRPAIRREHALARMAAEDDHPVVFVERPSDIRAFRGNDRRAWLHGLVARGEREQVAEGLWVQPRGTILPGHLSPIAASTNAALLHSVLRRSVTPDMSVVCSWPWDWSALHRTPARRRVFDMADDWGELMPGRQRRFQRYYDEIAAEADEIIVVSPDLCPRFPGRKPVVVRNGVTEAQIGVGRSMPEPRTMIYVGTLTPRFDAPLMRRVLTDLPDWRLDLVGACLYPKLGSAPAPELEALLSLGSRVRWHGALERDAAIPLLDRAAVAVVPNRPEHALGQDSMKFYDYASRGRPIVSTRWFDPASSEAPPHLVLAETSGEFAEGVTQAAKQADTQARDRREWAASNTWSERWPAWSAAVFGDARR